MLTEGRISQQDRLKELGAAPKGADATGQPDWVRENCDVSPVLATALVTTRAFAFPPGLDSIFMRCRSEDGLGRTQNTREGSILTCFKTFDLIWYF